MLVSSPDAVDTCRDKSRFMAAVHDAGLETPAVYADPVAVRYPAFVKPRWGKGGRGATKVVDAIHDRPVALVPAPSHQDGGCLSCRQDKLALERSPVRRSPQQPS